MRRGPLGTLYRNSEYRGSERGSLLRKCFSVDTIAIGFGLQFPCVKKWWSSFFWGGRGVCHPEFGASDEITFVRCEDAVVAL